MLIKDITDLKKFITVDGSVSFPSVAPYIAQAEQLYIIPALGPSLYATLNTAYNASSMSDDQKALWNQLNYANANFAWYLYLPVANVRMSEKGLVTSSTQESQQITKWMFDELRNTLKRSAYNMLDALYDFLIAGKAAPADWYAAWSDGPGYSDFTDLLVYNTAIMSEWTPVNKSRWIFTQMRSHIVRAEGLWARDFIGGPFFDDFKGRYLTNSLDDREKPLIQFLQPAISMMAYSMAIRDPNIRQEITVMEGSQLDGVPATGSNRADVDNRIAFDRVADQYASQAAQVMDTVREFLNAEAATGVFELYLDSPLYKNPTDTRPVEKYNNDSSSTYFMM